MESSLAADASYQFHNKLTIGAESVSNCFNRTEPDASAAQPVSAGHSYWNRPMAMIGTGRMAGRMAERMVGSISCVRMVLCIKNLVD
jgi:hypothetical protein